MMLLLGIGIIALLAVAYLFKKMLVFDEIPNIIVPTTKYETEDVIDAEVYDPSKHKSEGTIPCFDPSTMKYLGTMPAMTAKEVNERVERAWIAAETWKKSSFNQRRLVLKILLKYIVHNQDTICRVASRDSGKSMLDAVFGEIINTCEKLYWLIGKGEQCLKPEGRSPGIMMFYKAPRLEFIPLGVIGAIVPWNYPFHNVLNPVSAAIMAGNAIVIKVSEHASWSAKFYGAVISKALEAAGAPRDLVQIVTGYSEAGHALASAKLGKLIFVGSTGVGRAVMKSCVDRLTPLTLELGGKDAIVICDDCDFDHAVQTSLRGAFQASGANCVGAERFIVQSSIYDKFLERLVSIIEQMKQGPPLAGSVVDTGAICLPGLPEKIHELVEDAVSNGAKIEVGGIKSTEIGQYYPPTVLTNVSRDMRIWKEEVFGPVMLVVSFESDEEGVKMVNDCAFGLGSNVFSKNPARARKIASQIEAGMTSINDFASTYMSQSLPFGGLKESGFGRFGGIEGLRALCSMKSVAEDRFPWLMTTDIPPLLQYPIKQGSLSFVSGLVKMFYAPGLKQRGLGIFAVLKSIMLPAKPKQV